LSKYKATEEKQQKPKDKKKGKQKEEAVGANTTDRGRDVMGMHLL